VKFKSPIAQALDFLVTLSQGVPPNLDIQWLLQLSNKVDIMEISRTITQVRRRKASLIGLRTGSSFGGVRIVRRLMIIIKGSSNHLFRILSI
jgi:hypothetical protein